MDNIIERNSASWRWENKTVFHARTVYDCSIDRSAVFNGQGEMLYSQEVVKEGFGSTSLMLKA
ncbi:MAG TPA: hypothetical protein PKG91_03940, partial [Bacilli bacterium]|nr:hypothetical protein [Bacilli bacterium]